MPLMERIKLTSFLDLSYLEQVEKIRSVQQLRVDGMRDAARKKVRKTTKKAGTKKAKAKTVRKKKALTAIDSMNLEQLEALAKRHGLKI